MANIDVGLALRLSPPTSEPDCIGSAAASRQIGSSRRAECPRYTAHHNEPDADRGMKRQRCNQKLQWLVGSCDAFSVVMEDERPTLPMLKQHFPLCVQLLNNAINTFDAQTHLQMVRTPAHSICDSHRHQRAKPQMGFNKPVITNCQNQHCDILDHVSEDCRSKNNSNREQMEGSRPGNEETNVCQTVINHRIHDQNSHNESSYNSNNVANISKKASDGTRTRKVRRWWSLELHAKFMEAVSRLGGPKLATPNHILELMNVVGLTSQEVKSHLQKYRKQEGQQQQIMQAFNATTAHELRPRQIQQMASTMDDVWLPCARN